MYLLEINKEVKKEYVPKSINHRASLKWMNLKTIDLKPIDVDEGVCVDSSQF